MASLLDALAAVFNPQKPTPNMLGSGMAAGAANTSQLYPMWQQQFIDGETQLQFADWVKTQGLQKPVAGVN
jgi:hypothetical protein